MKVHKRNKYNYVIYTCFDLLSSGSDACIISVFRFFDAVLAIIDIERLYALFFASDEREVIDWVYRGAEYFVLDSFTFQNSLVSTLTFRAFPKCAFMLESEGHYLGKKPHDFVMISSLISYNRKTKIAIAAN